MAQEFNIPESAPSPQGAPKKTNTTLIIIIVAVAVLLCCCCLVLVLGYFFGDQILEALGLASHFNRGIIFPA